MKYLELSSKSSIKDFIDSPSFHTLETLKKSNLITSKDIDSFYKYIIFLCLHLENNMPNLKLYHSISTTIINKLSNSEGSLAYLFHTDLQGNKREKYIKALVSLQLLADIGDTYSDTYFYKTLGQREIIRIYNINTLTSHSFINILKGEILYAIDQINTPLIRALFRLRWDEFIKYQLVSSQDDVTYSKVNRIIPSILRGRQGHDLPLNSLKRRSTFEYAFSKGGTTYFLNLIRRSYTDTSDSKFDVGEFDENNTLFDLLNFSCDHICDIATDNGYENYENFLNKKDKIGERSFNAVHSMIKFELSKKGKWDKYDYDTALKKYTYDLVDDVYHSLSKNKDYNIYMFRPMLNYFFSSQKPYQEFSKNLLNHVNNTLSK